MAENRSLLEREMARIELRPFTLEGFHRRREQKERNRRISAAIVGIAIALLILTSLTWVLRSAERPAVEPTPPKPRGIFSEVGGWIVYGNQGGIWAVDPSHPGDPGSQIQLSPSRGTPLAWSSDGSKLLFSTRRRGLFVLHADGTETRLVRDVVSGASFSPDGTTVVFAPGTGAPSYLEPRYLDPGIYLIDADGGVPRLLLAPMRRYFPDESRSFRTGLSFPTFSPDGTQIAYIDGLGDWANSLRVMNADGSDVHVLDRSDVHLIERGEWPNGTGSVRSLGMHPNGLSWSPDGTRLAVGLLNDGLSVVDADGSGLTLVIPDGARPYWSPDGTRISYQDNPRGSPGPLRISAADGTWNAAKVEAVLQFGYAASGPWNPLVQPEPEVAEASASSGVAKLASILLPVAALLTLVVGFALTGRRRRAPGA